MTDAATPEPPERPEAADSTTSRPTTSQPTTSDPTAAARKDPEEWVTGGEPMTGPQASYLATLARETGRDVPERLSKAEASELIDDLQAARSGPDGPA